MEWRLKENIEEANNEAVKRIMEAKPVLVDIQPAIKCVPRMKEKLILHAGPPIEYDKMCGPMKGGIWGALMLEGLADNVEEAKKLAASGEIRFEPNHDHHAVGSMEGITSASMPMYMVKNETHGNVNYISIMNFAFGCGYVEEGRFGLKLQRWKREVFGPVLAEVVKLSGGIDLKAILAKGLYMGDEEHNRFNACNGVYAQTIMPYLVQTGFSKKELVEAAEWLRDDTFSFGPLMMGGCKNMMEPAMGIKYSTVVTVIGRNGVEVGIKVSDFGERWFTGPAQLPISAAYFPPYTAKDANPDLGDSAIAETRGVGGAAMAASLPAGLALGATADECLKQTRDHWQIAVAKDDVFKIPALDFQGVPVGFDIRKVVETGYTPIINTGMAHKEPGHPRIGSARIHGPIEAYQKALKALGEKYVS